VYKKEGFQKTREGGRSCGQEHSGEKCHRLKFKRRGLSEQERKIGVAGKGKKTSTDGKKIAMGNIGGGKVDLRLGMIG